MKKLKLNLLMVVAVAIAVVTMSFKMANDSQTENKSASHWYVKNPSTGIYSLQAAPPAECLSEETDNICALGFDSPQSNVTDASLPSSTDQRYREE